MKQAAKLMLVVGLALIPAVILGRGDLSGAPQSTPSAHNISVTRTPQGDYLVSYLVGTEQRSFTFTPNTKIVPSIISNVRRMERSPGFIYSYRFLNGRSAQQALAVVDMLVHDVKSASIDAPPPWRFIVTPTTERLLWMSEFHEDRIDGLEPGDQAGGFQIRTTDSFLPGPEPVGCKGNINPVLPSDIPVEVIQRLQKENVTTPFVEIPALVPSIDSGIDELNLTASVLSMRVMSKYVLAIRNSRHSSKAELMPALEEVVATVSKDKQAGSAALDRVRNLAQAAGQDEWAQSLGQGLTLCVDFIKSRFGL